MVAFDTLIASFPLSTSKYRQAVIQSSLALVSLYAHGNPLNSGEIPAGSHQSLVGKEIERQVVMDYIGCEHFCQASSRFSQHL